MKLLIVYASKTGQTEKIARRIADIAGETAVVILRDVRNVQPGELTACDAVVIAAPIRFDHYPRAVIRFVQANVATLRSLRSALVSVSGASMTPAGRMQAEDYVTDFQDRTRWTPDRCELVGGATQFTKYNPFIRFVIRRIARAKGLSTDTSRDHEYTDWEQVDRFARAFVAGGATKVA